MAAAVLLGAAAAGCGNARHARVSHRTTARSRSSLVTLTQFTVPPDGIAFFMHPTQAPIVLAVSTEAKLKVCEVGTTFSTYWHGGCRRLPNGVLALPSSGGAMHVGFRIRPATKSPTPVNHLRIQWHCVDHFYVQQGGGTAGPKALPRFDC